MKNLSAMWSWLLNNRWASATIAGSSVVLSYPPFSLIPLVFLMPLFMASLSEKCETPKQGFAFGFFVSFVTMVVGFHWVIYVIHVFGNVSWFLATLMFLGFCGFGALNFPLFFALLVWVRNRFDIAKRSAHVQTLWWVLLVPALFTLVEFLIPKLFPWSIGHGLFKWILTIQIVEFTGCTYLSFALMSLGGALYVVFRKVPRTKAFWIIPAVTWGLSLGYGALYLGVLEEKALKDTSDLKVGIVQANIGSLEKVLARKGIGEKVRKVVETYKTMTTELIEKENNTIDLILWPETAMPFYMVGNRRYPIEIRAAVREWNTRLITGGYAPYRSNFFADHNSAFLLEPQPEGKVRTRSYHKNILLAFGEYLPMGEHMPIVFKWFPQIANFKAGSQQNPIVLGDGKRLGVNICYEAIVPSFMRKIGKNKVQALINLTNDSWFGPTIEPHQHGGLAVFRSVEMRVPQARSTNTGVSFFVDIAGRQSETTPVYDTGTVVQTMKLPNTPPETVYLKWGDWFVLLCGGFIGFVLLIAHREKNASVPV